jgi:ribosomal 30S subunit maturation factor RimM
LDSETPKLVLLARIGAAHGVRGEVRVKSFTADPMRLAATDRSPAVLAASSS